MTITHGHAPEVSPEVAAEIERMKSEMKPRHYGVNRAHFTERQDSILLALWPEYPHPEVAERVGYCVNVCARRYKELTG